MTHFYVTLRSDLANKPGTIAKFTTTLPERIELEGDWEVGLSEISFPSLRHNITREHHYLQIARTRVPLRSGHCETVKDVLHEVTHAFNVYRRARNAAPVELRVVPSRAAAERSRRRRENGFYYVENIGRVGFYFAQNIRLQFSSELAHILGFSPMAKYSSRGGNLVMGETKADVRSNRPYKMVYVYADVIEPVVVGDSRVKLLRTVETNGSGSTDVVHRVFSSPVYLPLQTKNFDSIEIHITSDVGESMPFLLGKSTVTLHFKRVTEKYLSI